MGSTTDDILCVQGPNHENDGVRSCLLTITGVAKSLTKTVDSLCAAIKPDNLNNGIGLLTVKEKLLVFYLQHLTEFMKSKILAQKIEGSEIIDRLTEIRIYLERIQPIEKKLKYQIEKILKVAALGTIDENDPSNFRARPANMLTGEDSDEGEDESENEETKRKSGLYVPPKLSAVHYDGDETRKERRQHIIERARKRALQGSVMQELKAEYLDIPLEVRSTNSLKQMEDKYQKRKLQYEEDNFTRLPVTKSEIKRAKRVTTVGTLGDEITRFDDTSVLMGDLSSVNKKTKSKNKFKSHSKKKGGKKFKRR